MATVVGNQLEAGASDNSTRAPRRPGRPAGAAPSARTDYSSRQLGDCWLRSRPMAVVAHPRMTATFLAARRRQGSRDNGGQVKRRNGALAASARSAIAEQPSSRAADGQLWPTGAGDPNPRKWRLRNTLEVSAGLAGQPASSSEGWVDARATDDCPCLSCSRFLGTESARST